MPAQETVVIAGLGEVGRPLLEILSGAYHCTGIDVEAVRNDHPCSVLHVCYPYQIPDFVGVTIAYVEHYRPKLVIVNSTVAPGTTRRIQVRTTVPIVFSPVRGKHVKMRQDMLLYQKFVAGFEPQFTHDAAQHFAKAGFKVAAFSNPEIAELSKLVETTWLGVLVGWAQEVERMAASFNGSYEEVNSFIKEVAFLPSNVFPGHIAGHCVMPNIELLRRVFSSPLLEAVVVSNNSKAQSLPPQAAPKVDVSADLTPATAGSPHVPATCIR